VQGPTPVFVCTYMWLFVIYIYNLPLFIQWFQFTHHTSTVCLHFICEAGCAGGCGPVCAVGFYKCDVGNACFSVSVCASVEWWEVWQTDAAGVGVGISIFVSVSLFSSVYIWLSYIYISFNWCQTNRRGSSEFVLHTGNSLADNPCVFSSVCLSFMYSFVYSLFQVLLVIFLCLLLPSINFVSRYLGENPLRSEWDQI